MDLKKKMAVLAAFVFGSLASPALATSGGATGPDYTPLTDAIDITSTVAALLSVGGVLIAIALVVMGIRKVFRMVRGA